MAASVMAVGGSTGEVAEAVVMVAVGVSTSHRRGNGGGDYGPCHRGAVCQSDAVRQ